LRIRRAPLIGSEPLPPPRQNDAISGFRLVSRR